MTMSTQALDYYHAILAHESGHAVMAFHHNISVDYIVYANFGSAATRTDELRFELLPGQQKEDAKLAYLRVLVAGAAADLAYRGFVKVDQFALTYDEFSPLQDITRFLYAIVHDKSAYHSDADTVEQHRQALYAMRMQYKPQWDAQVQHCTQLFQTTLKQALSDVIALCDGTIQAQACPPKPIGIDGKVIRSLVP